jgi:hypothetical protein
LAVTAAVVTGGIIYFGNTDASQRNESPADAQPAHGSSQRSNLPEADIIRFNDYTEKKAGKLKDLIFYEGTVTIEENITMVSGVDGDTPVTGSTMLVSDEILVYDEMTDRCYVLARRMTALGDGAKLVDLRVHGTRLVTYDMKGSLSEYYGTGILMDFSPPSPDGNPENEFSYINFGKNPVRIDCAEGVVYTYPPVNKYYWVQVFGADGVEMVSTAVFTPEKMPTPDAVRFRNAYGIAAARTYGSRETLIYETSGGLVMPTGKVTLAFVQKSYDEIKDTLDQILEEAYAPEWMSNPAFKDVAGLTDAMGGASAAASGIDYVVTSTDQVIAAAEAHAAGDSAADGDANYASGDNAPGRASLKQAVAFGNELDQNMAQASGALGSAEAESAAVRSLEDFSMEGGSGDKGKAADAASALLPVLREVFGQYQNALDALSNDVVELRKHLSGESPDEEATDRIMADIQAQSAELVRISSCFELMSRDADSILLGQMAGAGSAETEYSALSRVYAAWKTTASEFLSGTAPVVDAESGIAVPDDYPDDVVPLLKDAVVVIFDKDDDGAYNLSLKTNMSAADVIDYYKSVLGNAQNLTEFEMGGMKTLSGEIGEYGISIMATANQLGGSEPTMVQITIYEN